MSSGIMSSLYESIVWEQLTGYESVSTVSIFRKAKEEGIELLQITKDNLETQLEKLDTDEATKQAVRSAVGNGNMVTIPAADVTIGEWSGTGYIIMDENRAGSYMITGGLNGGAVSVGLTLEVMVVSFLAVVALVTLIVVLIEALPLAIALAGISVAVILNVLLIYQMYDSYYDYYDTGDMGEYSDTEDKALQLAALAGLELTVAEFVYAFLAVPYLGNKKTGETSSGNNAKTYMNGMAGEMELANTYGGTSQVYFKTSQGGRYIDQLADGIAHESKVGYTTLTDRIKIQILKDVELINTGQIDGAHWHFFTSGVTGRGGASQPLLDFLTENGITYTIH